MSDQERYELLEPAGGGIVRSFRARDKVSGKEVRYHVIPAERTPDHATILHRIAGLDADNRRWIVELGKRGGAIVVVTEVLPGDTSLAAWLQSLSGPAEKSAPDRFSQAIHRTGTPETTDVTRSQMPVPVQPKPPGAITRMIQPGEQLAPPPSDGGEFTKLFRAPTHDAAQPKGRPAELSPKVATPPPGPGEFTRLFQSGLGPGNESLAGRAQELQREPAAGRPAAPAPPPVPVHKDPGEFTRLFGNPEAGKPSPPLPGLGEATRAFELRERAAPLPPSPRQQLAPDNPAPPVVAPPVVAADPGPAPQGPSEFTRIISRPASPPAPAADPAATSAPGAATPRAARVSPKAAALNFITIFLAVSGLVILAVAVLLYFALKG